jgi:hypothetical protein
MRYLTILALFLSTMAANAVPVISLSPSSTSLGLNEAFTIDVFVDGVELADQLFAFGFDVSAQTDITYNSATVAAPFFDDSGFFSTTDVAGSTFPAVSGDGILLATLDLTTGTTTGLLDVSIFSTAADFGLSEGLFTLSTTYEINETATVEVIGDAAVPLPSTAFLIGLGLLGMVRRTRS